MPPKVPNLKFKPKLVVQRKEDEDPSLAGDASSTMMAAAPSLTDNTSLQQERLRRLEATRADPNRDPGAGMSDYSRIRASDAAASASSSAPNTATGTTTRRTAAASSSTSGGGGGGAERSASATTRTTHLSAQARLNRAMAQNVDRSQYATAARPLPVNTMDICFSSDRARGNSTHSRVHLPVPLRPSASATTATPTSADAPAQAAIIADGTAFLREAETETALSYAANRRFHETMLAPLSSDTASASATTPTTPRTPQSPAGAPPLVWAQMPRFSLDPPFDLPRMQATGKVGELKVYKSGRMVMTIGSVSYDVSVDDEDNDGCTGCATMAAVTQPPAYPSDPASLASCYMLGQLQRKLICTPSLAPL